jgi:hypothetical protein
MTTTDEYPAFMFWPVPVDLHVPKKRSILRVWQDGRCAGCGWVDRLVKDHDHTTGLVRGLLCHACNVHEGRSDAVLWQRWRAGMNPATLVGHEEIYESPFGLPATTPTVSDEQFQRDLDLIGAAVTR